MQCLIQIQIDTDDMQCFDTESLYNGLYNNSVLIDANIWFFGICSLTFIIIVLKEGDVTL